MRNKINPPKQSKQLWIIVGIITTILLMFVYWYVKIRQPALPPGAPPLAQPIAAAPLVPFDAPETDLAQPVATVQVLPVEPQISQTAAYQPAVAPDLTEQPLPDSHVQVGQEIVQLDQVQQDLQRKQQQLEQQQRETDRLIELKQQQLQQLQAQLKS